MQKLLGRNSFNSHMVGLSFRAVGLNLHMVGLSFRVVGLGLHMVGLSFRVVGWQSVPSTPTLQVTVYLTNTPDQHPNSSQFPIHLFR